MRPCGGGCPAAGVWGGRKARNLGAQRGGVVVGNGGRNGGKDFAGGAGAGRFY